MHNWKNTFIFLIKVSHTSPVIKNKLQHLCICRVHFQSPQSSTVISHMLLFKPSCFSLLVWLLSHQLSLYVANAHLLHIKVAQMTGIIWSPSSTEGVSVYGQWWTPSDPLESGAVNEKCCLWSWPKSSPHPPPPSPGGSPGQSRTYDHLVLSVAVLTSAAWGPADHSIEESGGNHRVNKK